MKYELSDDVVDLLLKTIQQANYPGAVADLVVMAKQQLTTPVKEDKK